MRFPWKTAENAVWSADEWVEMFHLYENRKDLFLRDILAMYARTPEHPRGPSRSRFYQLYGRWVRLQMTGKSHVTLENL